MPVHPPARPSTAAILMALDHYGYPQPTAPAVVALRRPEEPGAWNDLIGVVGPGIEPLFVEATTDPGLQPMRGTGRIPTNKAGVARVLPGFYPRAYLAGYHGGGGTQRDHPALRQDPARPLPVERYLGGTWRPAGSAVGPFNLHRAAWSGQAAQVGDYSHGCLVVRDRLEHWQLLLRLGYPEHGPTAASIAQRWDLYLIDWSAYLQATGQDDPHTLASSR